jgi:hypothetical protein
MSHLGEFWKMEKAENRKMEKRKWKMGEAKAKN